MGGGLGGVTGGLGGVTGGLGGASTGLGGMGGAGLFQSPVSSAGKIF